MTHVSRTQPGSHTGLFTGRSERRRAPELTRSTASTAHPRLSQPGGAPDISFELRRPMVPLGVSRPVRNIITRAAGPGAQPHEDSRRVTFRDALSRMDGADAASIESALAVYIDKPMPWVPRAKEAIERGRMPVDLAQSFIRRLSPENRSAVLSELSANTRKHITGSATPHNLVAEKSLAFDWLRFRDPGVEFCPTTAWGFSTLACLVYEKHGISGKDPEAVGPLFARLVRGGFELKFIGDERDAKNEPRIACPMIVAFRDDLAIVAVRGSMSRKSWDYDFDTDLISSRGGRIHRGVARAAEEMWPELEPVLAARIAQLPRGKPLRTYFTGHSLGGVLSILLAHEANRALGVQVESIYTYGTPKALDADVARELESAGLTERTWRFENHRDVVVRLPETCPLPLVRHLHGVFVHIGSSFYCEPFGRIHANVDEDVVRRRERLSDFAAEGNTGAHSIYSYVRKLYLNRDRFE